MKKMFLCLVLIFLIITLTSCSHIEDTNGLDNYELTTITKDDVINGMNSNSFGRVEGHSTFSGSLNIKKFSGVSVLDHRKIKNKDVSIKLITNVENGNFGLFVITDNHIYDVPINQEYNLNLGLYTGDCTIKYAGESAEFKVTYEYIYK